MALFRDKDGRILFGETGGGSGGGITGLAVRAATDAERDEFHREEVREALAARDAADLHLKTIQDAHDLHFGLPADEDPLPAQEV